MFTNEYFSNRVSARTGEQGGHPNADRCRQGMGEGGQKSLKMCGHPLWMAPYHKMLMELKNFKKIIII